jgi:hypothetical protein
MISFLIVLLGYFGGVEVGAESFACDEIKISTEVTDTTNGRNNGKLEVKVDGGKEPYSYNYIGPAKFQQLSTNQKSLVNLRKGKYLIVVQDSGDCVKQAEVYIK